MSLAGRLASLLSFRFKKLMKSSVSTSKLSKNALSTAARKDAHTLRRLRLFVVVITIAIFVNYKYWTGKQQYPLLCNLFGARCPSWPITGQVARGYESVVGAFKKNFVEGQEVGASFTAYVRGNLVVQLYGGYKNKYYKRLYTNETLQLVFSSSKVVEGIVIAFMVDRGLLDYNERIGHYWLEFNQKQKENVTLSCLLGHRAGLTYLDIAPSFSDVGNLDQLAILLARQSHNFNGTIVQGYHAITRGWYLNEIVRRVDPQKRSMGTFIREELMPLLGFEFYLGIPRHHEHRISHLMGVPILRSMAKLLTLNRFKVQNQVTPNIPLFDVKSLQFKALFSQPRQIAPWPHSHNRKQIWRSEGPS